MGEMKDTLGDTPYPMAPGFKEATTSQDAARAMGFHAKELRGKVLDAIRNHPGYTADQIADSLGLSVLAIRPRVSELKAMGMIEKTGQRGKNRSGQSAHCWQAI